MSYFQAEKERLDAKFALKLGYNDKSERIGVGRAGDIKFTSKEKYFYV